MTFSTASHCLVSHLLGIYACPTCMYVCMCAHGCMCINVREGEQAAYPSLPPIEGAALTGFTLRSNKTKSRFQLFLETTGHHITPLNTVHKPVFFEAFRDKIMQALICKA